MNQTKLTLLQSFPNEIEAQIASNFLQSHGINCHIKSDNVGGMHPELSFTSGVKILVDEQLFSKAKSLLENPQPAPSEPSIRNQQEESAHIARPQKRKRVDIKSILLGLFIGILLGYQSYGMLNKETVNLDINGDGKIDNLYEYAGDFLVTSKHDTNFDGKFDFISSYDTVHSGKTLSDTNYDGKFETSTDFKYNYDYEARVDLDNNGVPDIFYTYENLTLKKAVLKPNGTKIIERKEIYNDDFSYTEYIDDDKNGQFDTVNYWDHFGYLVKSEKTANKIINRTENTSVQN